MNPFTPAGARQFAHDMKTLFATFETFSPKPQLFFRMMSITLRVLDMNASHRSTILADVGIMRATTVSEVPTEMTTEQQSYLDSLDLHGLSLRQLFRLCSNFDPKWASSIDVQ